MQADDTPVVIDRLKRRADFLRVAAERRKWAAQGLVLQAAVVPEGQRLLALKRSSSGQVPNLARQTAPTGNEPGSHSCTDKMGHRLATPLAQPSLVRIGFTVSKKVGNAVARNRARRRLRAAVDRVMAGRVEPWTDYVLIGRIATIDRPFDALVADLKTALDRIRRLAPGSAGPPPPRKGGKKARQGGKKTPRPSADTTRPAQ